MVAARDLAGSVGVSVGCLALGVSRATFYRGRAPRRASTRPDRPPSHRALSGSERKAVLDVLHSRPYVDKAPAEVYADLLDDGTYLCSTRTMYRILEGSQEVKERRDQLRHPKYDKPCLLATQPNQVWSWDITKLLGPEKWVYYYLYVILDLFSRYAVGWMVASRENASLANRLISETFGRHGIAPGDLTLHSDRGAAMTAKALTQLLATLGVVKSHSRPHVSNDNAYSESQFKTLKYHPSFPDRFGSQQHALNVCSSFFRWYNNEHHHWGLGLMTPADVHFGRAPRIYEARAEALEEAYRRHPERFPGGIPKPPALPGATWINPPEPDESSSSPIAETPIVPLDPRVNESNKAIEVASGHLDAHKFPLREMSQNR